MVNKPDIQKGELASLNQQLKAAHQELKVAHQQLQAEGQQLRASNQQFIAANQKLKETQKQLRTSRQLYEMLFKGTISGIAVYEAIDDGNDFILKKFNPAAEKIDKIKQHEIIGKSVLTVFPHIKEFGLFDVFQRVWRNGKAEHHPVSLYTDERIKGWRENYVFKLPTGEIASIYKDITERMQAEEKHQAILKTTLDGFFITDLEGRLLEANGSYCRMIGYSRQELLGMFVYDIEAEEGSDQVRRHLKKMSEKGSGRFETRHKRKDGRIIDVEVSVNYLDVDEGQMFIFLRDITERKEAEEALKESQQRYQALFEQAADSIVIMDAESGEMAEFNNKAYETLGYTREEFEKLRISDFEVNESSDDVLRHLEKVVKQGSDIFEAKHRTKNSDIRNIQVSARSISIHGRYFVQGIWRDITEGKKAERELTDSKNLICQVLDTTPNPIFVKDKNGRYIIVNKTNADLHNTTSEEMVGKTDIDYAYLSLASKKEVEQFLADDRMVIERKQLKMVSAESFTLPDGTIKWYQTTKVPISLEGNPDCVLGIAVDITERKKAEQDLQQAHDELEKRVEQRTEELSRAYKELEKEIAESEHKEELLRESEKFAAAGRLAAHVAHEINNPLAGIKNSFLLIKDSVPAEHKYYNYVALIEKEIDRLSNIVRQMYDLYQPIPEQPRKFRFGELVEDVAALLKVSSEEQNINIKVDIDASVVVKLPDGLLRQVMFNLIKNAIEASSQENAVEVKAEIKQDELIIEVRDRGVGIPEEIREKIFEPFYTERTEGSEAGLGLGLSVCRSIVDALEGRIEVQSRPGEGTVFTVYLPLENAETEPGND